MTITARTTQEDIVALYLESLGYDVDNSTSACGNFIKACRALLVLHPSQWSQSSANISFDPKLWAQQLAEAQQWLASKVSGAGSSVKHIGFGDYLR